ncbi:hypothetical protein K2Q02_00025, partial [Patescibacteria group bacterium]|nr:hypothetical protein [Patescibacteria group bacterium]
LEYQVGKFDFIDTLIIVLFVVVTLFVCFLLNQAEYDSKNNPIFTNRNVEQLKLVRQINIFSLILTLQLLLANLVFDSKKSAYDIREVIFNIGYELGYFACLYFASCTPKPLKKSWIKKTIEALSPKKELAVAD